MHPSFIVFIFIFIPAVKEEPDKTKLESRSGYLAKNVLQHPKVSLGPQDAFDVYEKGKQKGQIIITFAKGVKPPKDRKRPLQLRGTIRKIDLGGKPGTKSSYKNEMMNVQSWKYLKKLPL